MSETLLSLTPADPASPIPLYFQVESDLRRLIQAGDLPVGATVPPEQDLCRSYGVSRQTVRLALSRLAADDLISRNAGRGTFVLPQPDRTRFLLDRSFTRQMAEMGRRAHSRVLRVSRGRVRKNFPEPLRHQHGAPCLRLERLRLGDDEPIGIQQLTIITARCPNLEQFDFSERSLYQVLSDEYQLAITEIHYTVGATLATQGQADLLDIPEGSPLLIVNTTAYVEGGQAIEHTISFYRADRYVYSTTHVCT
ncbi:MAG TPA: GntR family transcriptional regulator [Rhodothermales bacterium]|nr:GntR family transcriptional regulator [Rhodothermales bacterium]